MNKLSNHELVEYYYNHYNLQEIFTHDMKSNMKLFTYNRHEHICTDNEDINYLLLFVKGKAKVYNTLSNGKSLLLCFYTPLMIIGDLEIFNSKINPTNVQSLELCHCIGIEMNYAKKFLINDIKFMRYINYSLSNKLDRCSTNNAINLLYKLENRLASYILTTCLNDTVNGVTRYIFDENLTNVAELLGGSYRHLLRTLNIFCTQNILCKQGNFYEIVDIAKLKELAKDLYK
ncbi:hypothetical protein Z967_10670 [Clostridium novyi A str. 4540]|uniref:cyclic nucleotide-binding domain-containing protein n=1 Tax=Clostridium novyi TaxID=1542 RepID=UPI0004D764BC|nr:cyclic nucleotide-binding domain-containing protein [Clostridium novyi]KEH89315.1 hypothetical protein Z967_10670 [Clostridium novyi A str. 4540]